MNIGGIDLVSITDFGLAQEECQQLVAGHTIDADIHSFAVHMLGIGYAAGLGIPGLTPQTTDIMCGCAKVDSGSFSQPDKQLLRFCRETIAIATTTFATQLVPGEIFDFVGRL